MTFFKKLRAWRRRGQFEADLAEEMRIHREMSGEAAFGSMALALEQSREVWGLAWLESWKRDLRYAARGLRRSPAFALGVIGAIGLGIGLNTTMFTVFNAYALRPYAVRDPYALYSISWYAKTGNSHWFTWDQFQNLRARKTVFSDVFACSGFPAQMGSRTWFGQPVTGNYFTMLGAPMALGRPLLPDDSGPVVVLSNEAWRTSYAADPAIVGRKIYLRGQPFKVIGVTGPAFSGIEIMPVGFWIPLRMTAAVTDTRDPFAPDAPASFHIVGRLQPGLTAEAAKEPLLAWSRGFAPDAVGVSMIQRATSVPLTHDAVITFIPLFTAFFLILVIACANVSNMMLARALSRQREIAIRISLGAARSRLIRQLLTESVLLALPAAAAGFLISETAIEGARRLLFATVPPAVARFLAIEDLSPDWRVFGFILAASIATALLFGLAPAIQTTRSRLVQANRGDFSSDYRPARLRNLLVIAQVAVCSLLLICTVIVLRSEGRAKVQPARALDTHGVWDLRLLARHQRQVADRLFQEPGVEAVAAAWQAPLYGSPRHIQVIPSSRTKPIGWSYNLVSAAYFPVFRIPLLRGRLFTEAESEAEAPVAVVGESTARRFWPHEDAIGQTIAIPPPANPVDPMFTRLPPFPSARVIGVVADRMSGMVENGKEEVCVYFPTHAGIMGNWGFLVRLRETANARRRLEAILDRIAPNLADFLNPMDDVYALQIYPFRITSWVASFLAGVALLMTLSGIYGVMTYLVSQRSKEIGIRMALGAAAWDVVRMVLRQSAWLAAAGAGIGVALALAIAPVFAHQMEVLQPYDWAPYAATAAVVLAAAVAASYAPARRAVGIDPVTTLRCD